MGESSMRIRTSIPVEMVLSFTEHHIIVVRDMDGIYTSFDVPRAKMGALLSSIIHGLHHEYIASLEKELEGNNE